MSSGTWDTAFRNAFGVDLEPADFKPKMLHPCEPDTDDAVDAP